MNKFKNKMHEKGITKYDIAEKTGFSIRRIDGYITGKTAIHKLYLGDVLSLAKALDCSYKDIVDDDALNEILKKIKRI